MRVFQRDLTRFEKLNAQVLGISPDDFATHERFVRKYEISYPLISDHDGAIQDKFDRGRVTYVIGRDGRIHQKQKGLPDNEALLKALQRLAND